MGLWSGLSLSLSLAVWLAPISLYVEEEEGRGGEGMTDVLLSEKPGVNCDSGQLLCTWFLPLGRLVVEIHLLASRYILPLHCHIHSGASTGVAWQWIRSTHLLSRINPLLLSFQVPRERRGEKNETAKSAFQFSPPSPEPDTIARGYAWATHTLLCLQVQVQSAHVKLPTGYCKWQ